MADEDDKKLEDDAASDDGDEADAAPEAAPEADDAGADDDGSADDDGGDDDVGADDDEPEEAPAPKVRTKKKSTSDASEATAADGGGDRMDLPKWNRARVKRKATKGEERDAFQDGVRKAGKGAVRRAPLLLGGVVVVAAGLAIGIWWTGKRAETKANETKLLAAAAMYEARGRVEEPEPERVNPDPRPIMATQLELDAKIDGSLSELANLAPDSSAARLAKLIEAGRAMKAADFAGAEAAYRAFVDAGGPDQLDFLGREGLVLALEAQGKLDDALTEVEPLLAGADPRGFFRDQALYHKGRLLEAKGDADGALAVYREYVEHFPLAEASIAREAVVERLTELDPEFVPPPTPGAPGLGGLGGLGGLQGLPLQ